MGNHQNITKCGKLTDNMTVIIKTIQKRPEQPPYYFERQKGDPALKCGDFIQQSESGNQWLYYQCEDCYKKQPKK